MGKAHRQATTCAPKNAAPANAPRAPAAQSNQAALCQMNGAKKPAGGGGGILGLLDGSGGWNDFLTMLGGTDEMYQAAAAMNTAANATSGAPALTTTPGPKASAKPSAVRPNAPKSTGKASIPKKGPPVSYPKPPATDGGRAIQGMRDGMARNGVKPILPPKGHVKAAGVCSPKGPVAPVRPTPPPTAGGAHIQDMVKAQKASVPTKVPPKATGKATVGGPPKAGVPAGGGGGSWWSKLKGGTMGALGAVGGMLSGWGLGTNLGDMATKGVGHDGGNSERSAVGNGAGVFAGITGLASLWPSLSAGAGTMLANMSGVGAAGALGVTLGSIGDDKSAKDGNADNYASALGVKNHFKQSNRSASDVLSDAYLQNSQTRDQQVAAGGNKYWANSKMAAKNVGHTLGSGVVAAGSAIASGGRWLGGLFGFGGDKKK
jgi:hypothetical protein